MSHEIRTPLNAVIGLTSLMKAGQFTDEAERSQAAERVFISSQNLLALVNDILDFSKIEAGEFTLEEIPFDLAEVVSNAAKLIEFPCEEKGVKLEIVADTVAGLEMNGDPTRLAQVLNNLLSNALKFTDHGTIKILVDVRTKLENIWALRFAVRDSGIGMSEEQQNQVFEKFSQADVSTSRQYGGTGLGLTICRNIVEMMGGIIEVSSTPGRGSEFSFTVPFKYKGQVKETPKEEVATPTLEIPKGKILVVEDNKMNQELMKTILKKSQNPI